MEYYFTQKPFLSAKGKPVMGTVLLTVKWQAAAKWGRKTVLTLGLLRLHDDYFFSLEG
jgi:hypothetical protein